MSAGGLLDVLQRLAANPVFAGVFGAGAVSFLLFQARALPLQLVRLAKARFVSTLTIYNDATAFGYLSLWLARHPYASRARRLSVTEWWDRETEEQVFELAPGPGPHLVRHAGRRFLIVREIQEQNQGGPTWSARPREKLTVSTIGSQAPIRELLEVARHVHDQPDVVPVYLWTGAQYSLVERRPVRPMSTIHLDEALKADLIADARQFLGRRGWYAAQGVPWRRGYLLEGPPGTGKSSFAFAMAGELRRPIHIVNLSTISSDNALVSALNAAGGGVLVVEDVDAAQIGVKRKPLNLVGSPAVADAAALDGITLSGLLNAIDGVAARDGRILILTSNHADSLDPALLRPGRVDRRVLFGPLERDPALAMFSRFLPSAPAELFESTIAPQLPIAAADLQNQLLQLEASDAR